jgi:hypothetical protein
MVAFSTYLVSAVGLGGGIERLPSPFLPSYRSVTKVNSRLVQQPIDPGTIRIRDPSGDQRSASPYTFSVGVGVFFGNASFSQCAHNAASGRPGGRTDGRRSEPSRGNNRSKAGNSQQPQTSEQTRRSPQSGPDASALASLLCTVVHAITIAVFLISAKPIVGVICDDADVGMCHASGLKSCDGSLSISIVVI